LADAIEYLQSDGDDDYEMASRAVFYGLFLGQPSVVDDLILMQGKKYQKYITKACDPRAKEVVLNDAIAYGRLEALTNPLKFADEMEGINRLINLCSKAPSVDISIESIRVLRATFGKELADEKIDLLGHFIETVPEGVAKFDAKEALVVRKNLTSNIAFGVFYAWSIEERVKLLETLN
jgi:hypothetical protein